MLILTQPTQGSLTLLLAIADSGIYFNRLDSILLVNQTHLFGMQTYHI